MRGSVPSPGSRGALISLSVLLWFGVFCFVFVFLLGEIRPANCPETAEEGVGKGERET